MINKMYFLKISSDHSQAVVCLIKTISKLSDAKPWERLKCLFQIHLSKSGNLR